MKLRSDFIHGIAPLVATMALTPTMAGAQLVGLNSEKGIISIEASGVPAFQGTGSVAFQLDGKNQRLSITNSNPGETSRSSRDTPFGKATMTSTTWTSEDSRFGLTLKISELADHAACTMQAVFHNHSDQDVNLNAFELFDQRGASPFKLDFPNPESWLATPLMQDTEASSLAETTDTFKEAAILYQSNDKGFLIGPVGPAEAHASVDLRNQKLAVLVQMDGVLVRAGENRRSEEMIFAFEPSRKAIKMWTEWVASTHKARTKSGAIYGWCSWYDRTTKIDEAHVRDVLGTIRDNPNTFGRGVVQIDDGYQKMDGDWSANDKFPGGMAKLAADIREVGCLPGVWFAPLMINPNHPWIEKHPDAIQTNAQGIASFMNANPFHPAGAKWLNPDHPESKKFLFNIIKDARDRGYGYIKIDFNGIGNRFVDPTKTRLQIFRELYTLYREAAGDDMYILSCLGQPTRGVIGFIDAARVGPDSHPAHFDKCLKSVQRFQIFDNVWWQNDPDVSYLATEFDSRRVGRTPQGEGMWKTWHNINTLVGGTAMISEPINKPDVKEAWRNYEIMRPGSAEPARLVTLGTSPQDTIFGFTTSRDFGNFAVYNAYNCTGERTHITIPFGKVNLPTEQDYAVFDFWENKVIAITKGSYNTKPLDPFSSALVRFTPLSSEKPLLVGSNLHLSIGATEIEDIELQGSKLTIKLTDAGAQKGSLTFHSGSRLTPGSSQNCRILGVEDLGDKLWKVNIAERKFGANQEIELTLEPGVLQSAAP